METFCYQLTQVHLENGRKMEREIQAWITVGVGPRHCRTVGSSVSRLSPNYTENKYVKRVAIFFFVYLNHFKYSTVRSLREIDILVQKNRLFLMLTYLQRMLKIFCSHLS